MPQVDRFTARKIEQLVTRVAKELKPGARPVYYEAAAHGKGALGLRLSQSGGATWLYTYHLNGKVRHHTLGNYPKMSLEDAHEAYAKAVKDRSMGYDPGAKAVEQRQAGREAPTVKFIADEYIRVYAKRHKRSWQTDENLLKRNVLPYWGEHKADAITLRDVGALLEKIYERGAKVPANRTRSCLSKMFNWARQSGLVTHNPVTGSAVPHKEEARERTLSESELAKVLKALPETQMAPPIRLAFQFQLLTAARVGEVAGARWSEVDEVKATWTIPAERSKNKMEHKLPLSPQAMAVLEAAKELRRDSDVVFPSPVNGVEILGTTIAGAVRENLKNFGVAAFTPHDLRRTAATQLAEMDYAESLIERVLNHKRKSLKGVYIRPDYVEKMRGPLDAWGAKLEELRTKGASNG